MNEEIVIGVDLGTINTCAACYLDGKLQILENAEGNSKTVSYVFFSDTENAIVGQIAKKIAANKPEHGIYEIKRILGKQFHEIEEQQNLPFVIKNVDGYPQIYFEQFNSYKNPEQISAHILRKIKKDISSRFGQNINKAVITIPAHFNVSQRKATLKSAEMAGFVVVKLLSEATAAALNYLYETRDEGIGQKFYLVYDFGDGTFDVAIVQKNQEDINIICVDGDSYLGGRDFDNLILTYLCQELKTNYKSVQHFTKRDLRRLRHASTSAKETLTTARETTVILEDFNGFDLIEIALTRKQFEEMADELIQRSIRVVDRCLKASKLSKKDISEILLAGGSTRIPRIQELLREYFDGQNLNRTLHPEHCVASGAALQAAMLSKSSRQNLKIFKIREVISSSLGIADVTNKMNFIIKKNTSVPTSDSVTHATVVDQQKTMSLEVYEGERLDARKNIHLGTLKITNLTPAPPGKCRVTINLNVDGNGILTIAAKEKHKRNFKDLQIALVRDARSSHEDDETEDERFIRFTNVKEFLISYGEAIDYNFNRKKLVEAHREMYERCRQIQLDVVNTDLEDEAKLVKFWDEIVKICSPLVEAYRFEGMPSAADILDKLRNNT